jgi:hypothetical protein
LELRPGHNLFTSTLLRQLLAPSMHHHFFSIHDATVRQPLSDLSYALRLTNQRITTWPELTSSFRSELDATWAVRPLALSQYNERTVLVLDNLALFLDQGLWRRVC